MFRPSPDLFPFRSRFFHAGAGRVHYVDEGSGHPILFLHGNPTWSFLYRHLIDRLRARYRCIALDYPGFGLSGHPRDYGYTPAEHARVVLELVKHLGLRELAIFGQDWGGPIGLWVALQLPERVSHLIFGNTAYRELGHPWIRLFSLIMSSAPAQWAIRERNIFVEWVMPLAMATRLGRCEMDHYRAVLPTSGSRRGVAELPRQLRLSRPWIASWSGRVPVVLGDVPLLLVWGMGDPAFRPRFMRAFLEDFRHPLIVELPLAKHYIQEDAPGAIARAMTPFLG